MPMSSSDLGLCLRQMERVTDASCRACFQGRPKLQETFADRLQCIENNIADIADIEADIEPPEQERHAQEPDHAPSAGAALREGICALVDAGYSLEEIDLIMRGAAVFMGAAGPTLSSEGKRA